jgi:heme exporter protein C
MDYMLYVNQKIFYYHVPAWFVMFGAVFVSGFGSIQFLRTRNPEWDDVAAAAADIVLVFGTIGMVTGPIWAEAAWGVPWIWEARLTTALLLWMIFLAHALVRRYGGPGSERLSAGLGIFGMVNVPLVYMAVNFWKTQHPTTKVVPALAGDMKKVFWMGVGSYLFLAIALYALRLTVGRAQRRLAAAHDLAVENGHLD